MTTTLLIVDGQKDFHIGGSLVVTNADEDAERIANCIRQNGRDKIQRVVATMDSHHKLHIAHPSFWYNQQGEHPSPYTPITLKDIQDGKWKPRTHFPNIPTQLTVDPTVFDMSEMQTQDGNLDITKYCIEYTRRLEAQNKSTLFIWPEHCLIGSEGHAYVPVLQDALHHWSDATGGCVEWVLKGQNLFTEMFSVMKAEVPVSKDTEFNQTLQDSLMTSDRLIVCGQALSHCVNRTLRDIVEHWPEQERSKIYLALDCTSSVPGFEQYAEECVTDMKKAGVQVMNIRDIFQD